MAPRLLNILVVPALVAPIDERNAQLGGAQALVADLARGLATRGHSVSLAAPDGSFVSGVQVLDLGIEASRQRRADFANQAAGHDTPEQRAAFRVVRDWLDRSKQEVEVVSAHAYDAPAFDTLRGAPRRVIHTLHLPPLDPGVREAAICATDATLVTVSRANAQAWERVGARIAGVVPNGVDVDGIPFGLGGGGYALAAGRVSPEKGTDAAVRAASGVGLDVLVVGGIYDDGYFSERVRPLVAENRQWRIGDPIDGALYIGPRSREELHRVMADAAITLMPVRWDEPFGIVALESLATGTPVVAFRRGGLGEILDETSGVLVRPDDEAAFAEGLRQAVTLDRSSCRRRANRFSLDDMLRRYEEVLAD